MTITERIMIEEKSDNNTYTVLITPLKEDIPSPNWREVAKDDFSWWDMKEKANVWSERKIRKELGIPSGVSLLEGMVFIRITEEGKVKESISYTSQARAASKEVYGKVLNA